MRCPNCSKFVPYDEPNCDDLDVNIDGEELTLSGPLGLPCAECGEVIATAEMDDSRSVADEFDRHANECAGETEEYEIDGSPDFSPTDRTQDKDRRGKPIKNARYAKRFYGAEASVEVTLTILDRDGNEVGDKQRASVTLFAEKQAGDFESTA